ncbi:gamma-glutamyltransferase 1 Threonine peptidase. MEROPS family T03 [Noviherbaspirillum humi]|uniref:Glutathione hydrolase proenzyme n=1 Tax=Noviherbaspirillum humi TaxID=1688639 RepID=A0A239HS16_9BURK|nr:gamma-glutamyltransferase [Noviherbaspirillum humi]SNS83868.1 gamma-glutamyltransferase 1 Threonine peptidase. MEROPS family T03 [Noviherbaspirillum humi]
MHIQDWSRQHWRIGLLAGLFAAGLQGCGSSDNSSVLSDAGGVRTARADTPASGSSATGSASASGANASSSSSASSSNGSMTQLRAGAVASPDVYGADTAKTILDAGGNAIDAAVAVAFTLAVTFPNAGNIGGGGFMTIVNEGTPYFLDYRERAPKAATSTMYLDANGNVIPNLSLIGNKAVGVPGTVAGMWEAHKRFGRLTWSQVLAPAIGYAQNGFVPNTSATAGSIPGTNFDAYFGGKLTSGQNFVQAELAQTLTRIRDQGGPEFYNGQTADLLVAEMQRGNGLITKEDLQSYAPVWRDPVQIQWRGVNVITAPPPSSGGFGIGQLLKMKEALSPQFAMAPLNSAQYIHLTAEMEKRVFADRAQYLGDPDFFQIPMDQLLDDGYLARRAAEVNPSTPTPLAQVQPGLGTITPPRDPSAGEKPQTTHFSIVDRWGNAVGNTYTLNGSYGSGVVVTGAGFLLNNEMDDFASKPGVPNQFGVVGGDVNAIEPFKRPLSSMSPTIVTRDGKVSLVLGTPGGSRIFTSVYQVLVDVVDYGWPLAEAQAQARFHHQLLPDNVIEYEADKIPKATVDNLTARGWIMKPGLQGGANIEAIQVIGDTPFPVSDPRGKGVSRVIEPVQ